MPGLVKKLAVIADVEGLTLHPLGQRNRRTIQIQYATHAISSLGPSAYPNSFTSTEAHGIVGILDILS